MTIKGEEQKFVSLRLHQSFNKHHDFTVIVNYLSPNNTFQQTPEKFINFIGETITYLIAFNVMALVYPIAGCIREFFRFGFIDGGNFIYQAAKAVLYSLLLNSATFFIAIWICFSLRNSAKAIAVTAVTTFVLSLYLGFGMMLKFPVAFLPTYQIREAVTSTAIFQPFPILIGIVWVVTLLILSWCSFRKCELK